MIQSVKNRVKILNPRSSDFHEWDWLTAGGLYIMLTFLQYRTLHFLLVNITLQ